MADVVWTQVAEAGGFQVAGALLAGRVDGQSRRELMDGLDVTSVTLGVLINLAECRPQDVHRLAGGDAPGDTCILRTLCRLIEARFLYPGQLQIKLEFGIELGIHRGCRSSRQERQRPRGRRRAAS